MGRPPPSCSNGARSSSTTPSSGGSAHPLQRPQLWRGLASQPFWDSTAHRFPWLPHLLASGAMAAMQQEAAAQLRLSDLAPQPEGVHVGGQWGELHCACGPLGEEQRPFPSDLAAACRELSTTGTEVVNARLSALTPGTHITAHCGVSNAKLRAHVALSVPPQVGDGHEGGTPKPGDSGGHGVAVQSGGRPACRWRVAAVAARRGTHLR